MTVDKVDSVGLQDIRGLGEGTLVATDQSDRGRQQMARLYSQPDVDERSTGMAPPRCA
jgi:hypothetical protein